MSDQDPMAEAYHVLGGLNEGLEESEAELRKLRDQADQEHKQLLEQQAEAERMGDQASLERLGPMIEQAQQAWIIASRELGEDQQDDDQTPDEQEDDDDDVQQGGPAERPGDVAEVPQEGDDSGDEDRRAVHGSDE